MAILQPKKLKYPKSFRGKMRGIASRGTELNFGSYGLKALELCWITARQIEAARRAIMRYLKKGGKLWVRIFPHKPVTSKGIEFALGGGKGPVSHYVATVKPGKIIFELEGIPRDAAKEALEKAADKLPIKTKFVEKSVNS